MTATTPNRGWPLPNNGSATGGIDLNSDIQNLIDAFLGADGDVQFALNGIAGKADLDSPDFTGEPTAPTAPSGDDSGKLANTAFVQDAISGKVSTSLTINGKPLTANVTLDKSDIGLDNVDNTTDADKPVSTAQAALFAQLQPGRFYKADRYSAAFTKTGAGTISLKAGTIIEVNGSVYTFAADTAVSMPALTAGTDYAIWIKPDGTLVATSDFVSPPVANSRQIGGFHYAPGGNATAMAGGDTTPAINAYSIWDLKFRPACADPRGMTLVAGAFWCDIYLLGIDHLVNGTSKYNVTIADGSSPPKIPTLFGGNGTSVYGGLTWWQAAEVMASYGKRLLSYQDFAAAAYGTTENSSAGTDPGSTILRQAYTSKWGVMLATGNMWVWGDEFGGGNAAAGWSDTNGGRGQVYQQSNALLFGGYWDGAAYSGSRASAWYCLPSGSNVNIGARGRCDHLCLV